MTRRNTGSLNSLPITAAVCNTCLSLRQLIDARREHGVHAGGDVERVDRRGQPTE